MPSEDDDLTTLTVTIALDDDDGDHGHKRQDKLLPSTTCSSALEKYYIIRSPISAKHACPLPSEILLISDLPLNAQKLICNRLNSPAIGSMKNWLYLSALIGLKDDEISSIRQTADPMMEVFKHVQEVQLIRLIRVIGDIGRIDVLISLKPFLHGLSSGSSKKAVVKNVPNRNIFLPMINNDRFDSGALTDSVKSLSFQFPSKKFIIITHHETAKVNKRNIKHLLVSLRSIAEQHNKNIEILDIAKCIDETNISQTARNLFKYASQIVLFISSPDYISNISNSINPNDNNNALIMIKKLFHCWMDEEYNSNGCRNLRFRIILYKDVKNSNEVLPIGWPRTTLQYTFPHTEQFDEICKRLFE
uniref:SEFIR domain-containing protein n=1 Tax=Panagrolaimus sp. ES5 TaxID=591445 RepID=A0AC34FBN5_9BILA